MPGTKLIKSASWSWFKSELDRLLGPDQAAALFEDLRQRRRLENEAEQRKVARNRLAYFERQLAERQAEGRATARIEASIARWRAIADGVDDDASQET